MAILSSAAAAIEYFRCHDNVSILNSSTPGVTPDPSLWRLVLKQERIELQLKIPAFTILALLMVVGVLGNGLVLAVYGCSFGPSTTRVFVIAMAAFDLLNCAVGIPFEMADLRDDITLHIPGACKIFRFLITVAAAGSVTVLVFVSLDRFRRVCRPLHRQMTTRQAKGCVLIACILALGSSLPALIFYGVKTEYRYGFRLYDCSIDDSWGEGSSAVFVYQVFLAVVWIVCIILLTVVYIFIIYKIKKQQLKRLAMSSVSSQGLHSVSSKEPQKNNPQITPERESMSCDRTTSNGLHDDKKWSDPSLQVNKNVNVSKCEEVRTDSCDVQRDHSALCQDEDCKSPSGVEMNRVNEDTTQKAPEEVTTGNHFVRLFSRDVNPVKSEDGQPISPMRCVVPDLILEDASNSQEEDDGSIFTAAADSLSLPKSAGCRTRAEFFSRQSSLNNYFSASQTSEGSIELLGGIVEDGTQSDALNGNAQGGDDNSRELSSDFPVQHSTATVELHYKASSRSWGSDLTLDEDSSFSPSMHSNKAQWGSVDDRLNAEMNDSCSAEPPGSEHTSQAIISDRFIDERLSSAASSDAVTFTIGNDRFDSEVINDDIRTEYLSSPDMKTREQTNSETRLPTCASDDILLHRDKSNNAALLKDCQSFPFVTAEDVCNGTQNGFNAIRRASSLPSLSRFIEGQGQAKDCPSSRTTFSSSSSINGSNSYRKFDCDVYSQTKAMSASTIDTLNKDIDEDKLTVSSPTGSGNNAGRKRHSSGVTWDPKLRETESKDKNVQDDTQNNNNNNNHELMNRKLTKSRSDSESTTKSATTISRKNSAVAVSRKTSTSTTKSNGREIKTSKLTMMMLAVSVAFILSYLPHLGVQIFRGLHPQRVSHLLCTSNSYFAWHHVLLRSFLINNAINPIIYCVFNETFRRKAKALIVSALAKLMFHVSDKCGRGDTDGLGSSSGGLVSGLCCGRCRNWTLSEFTLTSSRCDDETS